MLIYGERQSLGAINPARALLRWKRLSRLCERWVKEQTNLKNHTKGEKNNDIVEKQGVCHGTLPADSSLPFSSLLDMKELTINTFSQFLVLRAIRLKIHKTPALEKYFPSCSEY